MGFIDVISEKMADLLEIINRPGVAGAVLQTALSLINNLTE